MIKLVVDVGLPSAWVDVFARHGWPAGHWPTVGDPRAKDRIVMAWAREHGHVVFTHDLDFGALLALTRASGQVLFRSAPMMYSQRTSKTSSSPLFECTRRR